MQITGNLWSVRKALLSISSCLQENPRADAVNSTATRSSGTALHGTGTEYTGASHRMIMEEEVVFKLLCQVDKIGSLIGKGGSVIRALQSETGASIKIADTGPDSDERVVVISAREACELTVYMHDGVLSCFLWTNSEQRHSPAQDALIRVHCRISDIGFEPGAAVVARLLVIGNLHSVNEALFQITSRLRETIFPAKPFLSNASDSPYLSPYPEMPPPMFRPRHDPASPGNYPSPARFPRGVDHVAFPAQPLDPLPQSHGMDHVGPTYFDCAHYPYGSERPGHGPSSPRRRTSQAVASGNPRGNTEFGGDFTLRNDPIRSGSQPPIAGSTTVEVLIPQKLLSHVYGENNGNLGQIRQFSGAKIVIHDLRPGAAESVVVVSGTPDQIYAAQSLVHAFILAELPF
ncbi:hypothetical protein U1Q18_006255 [Sarracenia purpurea var. burkii]